MNYIKIVIGRLSLTFFLVMMLSGCFGDSEFWLYNFTGSTISIVYPNEGVINNEAGMLLADGQSYEGESRVYDLKIDTAEGTLCYILSRIKVGGYGEYKNSTTLVFRFKLDEDNILHVYRANNEFNPSESTGIQPEGYPVAPVRCPVEG